ncbi:hypothetical protein LMG24235_06889 [Paraburkholderia sabiae]|nr:hypothetical protein LMG24235_06889 [Paraburkholderia sabiae]
MPAQEHLMSSSLNLSVVTARLDVSFPQSTIVNVHPLRWTCHSNTPGVPTCIRKYSGGVVCPEMAEAQIQYTFGDRQSKMQEHRRA